MAAGDILGYMGDTGYGEEGTTGKFPVHLHVGIYVRTDAVAELAVNPYPVRAFVLAHLESVDFVVRFDEDTPAKLIEAVQPDVLVKGGDWSVNRIVGRETVQRRGGEVISLPLLQGYSTTALIEKIRRTAPGSR